MSRTHFAPQNGAGKRWTLLWSGMGRGRGALLWSGMAPVVLGLWLRPGTRGVRQAWCSVGRAGVRGAGGLGQGGVRWASTPWARWSSGRRDALGQGGVRWASTPGAGRAEYMRRAIAECPGHEVLFHGVRAARELCQGRAGTPGAHISVLINGLRARVSPPKVADDRRSGGVTTPILQKMLKSRGVTTPKQCKFFDLDNMK